MDHTQPDEISVVVTRTGGIAGIRRAWRAVPGPEQASEFAALVERCPWDDPPRADEAGADRFMWVIAANLPGSARQAELPESGATGAWRSLIDAVRAWASEHRELTGRKGDASSSD
ncbi:hypothetical protein GCM10009796_00900 [Microbacterium koreense]